MLRDFSNDLPNLVVHVAMDYLLKYIARIPKTLGHSRLSHTTGK